MRAFISLVYSLISHRIMYISFIRIHRKLIQWWSEVVHNWGIDMFCRRRFCILQRSYLRFLEDDMESRRYLRLVIFASSYRTLGATPTYVKCSIRWLFSQSRIFISRPWIPPNVVEILFLRATDTSICCVTEISIYYPTSHFTPSSYIPIFLVTSQLSIPRIYSSCQDRRTTSLPSLKTLRFKAFSI